MRYKIGEASKEEESYQEWCISKKKKKEWNNAICNNMDGPRDYYTKWSKINIKTKVNIIYHLYVESKKIIQMNIYQYKT